MKKFLSITLFAILISGYAIGQNLERLNPLPSYWSYTYDISVPLGETADFVSAASFRGFSIEGRSFIKSNLSIGGSIGWHVFYEEVRDEVINFSLNTDEQVISGAVSGVQYRYINAFPILFNADYYFGDINTDEIIPFVGLGAGTSIVSRRLELGIVGLTETSWRLAVSPELGATFKVGPRNHLIVSGQYMYNFKNDPEPSTSYLSFGIGFTSYF